MISIKSIGNFNRTEKFLNHIKKDDYIQSFLDRYGQEGVKALALATPKRSGLTASSWDYKVEKNADGYAIHWLNHNINRNVNIAIIIQLGHGTRQGAYVEGIDYINPAMRPVFENAADEIWKKVTEK